LPQPLRRRLVRYRKTTPDPQVQAPIRAGPLNRARIAYYQPRSQIWRPVAKMHSKSFLTTPRIARASKSKPSPESQDSPRTRAKQPETSPKGGVLHSAPHDARMRLPPKLQNRSLRVTQGLNRVFRKLHFDSLHKRQNFGIWIEKDDQEEPSATQRLSPHSLRRVSPQKIRGPCCRSGEEHA